MKNKAHPWCGDTRVANDWGQCIDGRPSILPAPGTAGDDSARCVCHSQPHPPGCDGCASVRLHLSSSLQSTSSYFTPPPSSAILNYISIRALATFHFECAMYIILRVQCLRHLGFPSGSQRSCSDTYGPMMRADTPARCRCSRKRSDTSNKATCILICNLATRAVCAVTSDPTGAPADAPITRPLCPPPGPRPGVGAGVGAGVGCGCRARAHSTTTGLCTNEDATSDVLLPWVTDSLHTPSTPQCQADLATGMSPRSL